MDYFYSQDGGDLMSYGIPGRASIWDDNGELEWIHPLLQTPDADFWTLLSAFKVHVYPYLRDSTAYYFAPEVWECIRVWGEADNSWILPTDLITFTSDEATENARIMTDVDTHVEEQSLAFITGTRPMSEFDAFVAELESMNIQRSVEIHQAALDRLSAR
jgi:putative aldouronate transport system substrate-binding protein